jgi:hypothetical protein
VHFGDALLLASERDSLLEALRAEPDLAEHEKVEVGSILGDLTSRNARAGRT